MPRFGDLEAAIMDRIWSAHEPLSVRQILDQLRTDRSLAYTTVQTVTDILHRKGWLHREKRGRAYRYWPTANREEYTAWLMSEALDTSPDRTAALARFVGQMDPAEIAELRAVIGRARTAEVGNGTGTDGSPETGPTRGSVGAADDAAAASDADTGDENLRERSP